MTDSELLERAVRGAGRGRDLAPRWAHIMTVFALGSTSARELARRFDLDPEELIGESFAPCIDCERRIEAGEVHCERCSGVTCG